MNEFDVQDGTAIPVITGYVDRVKAFTPEKYWGFMPLVSIATGIAYTLLAKPGNCSVMQRVVLGAYLGLSASGLFAAVNHWSKVKAAKT